MIQALEMTEGILLVLDQRFLPERAASLACRTWREVARAIAVMAVRGAPAIGIAAAYGMALAARDLSRGGARGDDFMEGLRRAGEGLTATRPTAVNLAWAVERMLGRARREAAGGAGPDALAAALAEEAAAIHQEDVAMNRRLGRLGADLMPEGARILTHCNTGALATGGYGTALGVVRAAREQGKQPHVYVDETRPYLQGARLTAWELVQEGIPATLITDSMAGHFMKSGQVDLVLLGADRICRNGDFANKIGTYSLAVLAHHHGLPFYTAAPWSTMDMALPSGDGIVIEERDAGEVRGFGGVRWAPEGVGVANPAFDVTPAHLVTAIITDRGIARPPFDASLAGLAAMAALPAPAPGAAYDEEATHA